MPFIDNSGIHRTKKLFLLLLLHVFLIILADRQLGHLEDTAENLVAQSNIRYQTGLQEVGTEEEQITLAFESYKQALKTKNTHLYQSLTVDQKKASQVNDAALAAEYEKIKGANYQIKIMDSVSATLSIHNSHIYTLQLIDNQWKIDIKNNP